MIPFPDLKDFQDSKYEWWASKAGWLCVCFQAETAVEVDIREVIAIDGATPWERALRWLRRFL